MVKFLLTGANRGIGLALTRAIVAQGDFVFACCRAPQSANELQELAQQHPHQMAVITMDVTDDSSIATALQAIAQQTTSIDYLLNNAGIGSGPETLGTISRQHLQKFFNTNSTSPIMVAQAALPLLKNSSDSWIINFSSILGSIGSGAPGIDWSSFAYRSSKCALNMLSNTLATFLQGADVHTIALHPGWVKTDMGGQDAPLPANEAAQIILATIQQLQPKQSGGYIDLHGQVLPW